MQYPKPLFKDDGCQEQSTCRRMFPRLRPCRSVYIAYGDRAPYVGELKDAGMGGISFDYVQIEKPITNRDHMDILIPELRIRIRRIPCRMIYKKFQPIDLRNRYAFVPMQIFRCGLAFKGLHSDQALDLEKLLVSHTFNA